MTDSSDRTTPNAEKRPEDEQSSAAANREPHEAQAASAEAAPQPPAHGDGASTGANSAEGVANAPAAAADDGGPVASDAPAEGPRGRAEGGEHAAAEGEQGAPAAGEPSAAEGDPAAGEPSAAESAAEGDPAAPAEGQGGGSAAPEQASSPGTEAAEGDEKAKRKRRRRRRKKKAGAAAEGEGAKGSDKKDASQVPLLRFFEGADGFAKRHAFSVGEVVAGRVERVEHGTIVVDLFGKAKAIVDEREPREVPIAPASAEGHAPAAATPEAPPSQQAGAGEQGEGGGDVHIHKTLAVHGAPASSDHHVGPSAGPSAEQAVPSSPEPGGASAAGQDGASGEQGDGVQPSAAEGSPITGDTLSGAAAAAAEMQSGAASAQTDSAQQVIQSEAAPSQGLPETLAQPHPEAAGGQHAGEPAPADATSQPSVGEPSAEAAASDVPAEGGSATAGEPGGEADTGPSPAQQQPPAPSDEAVEAAVASIQPGGPADQPPPEPPQVGAIFRGRVGAVAESGHIAIINRVVERAAVKRAIERARESRQRVEGVVFGFNRGGFDVIVGGIRAFCPASGMALEHVGDPAQFVGRKLEFTVPPAKGGSGIVVSRRTILEKELRKKAKQRIKELQAGQRLSGKVTQVREFGLLVDLGDGLEGLVHQSELAWERGVRPADVAKPGDDVEVQVLEVKRGSRKERHGRVSLSRRALLPDPWDQHQQVLQEGTPQKGKVVSTTEFGAFVELAPGCEGLLHVTELGRDLKHAKEAVGEGEELDVIVERVDKKQRRISLSKLSAVEKQMLESGELDTSQRPKSLKPGSHIRVLVDRVEHTGIHVRVQGVLGKKGRGFIPNRELRGEEGPIDRKSLQAGSPLEVKITGTERSGQLRCSIRARQIDEERQAVQEYRREASKKGLGTFGDLLKQKLEGALQDDRSSNGG